MLKQIRDLLQEAQIEYDSLLEIALADELSLFTFEISGSKAISYWKQLAMNDHSGMRPLILGTEDSLEAFMEHLGQTHGNAHGHTNSKRQAQGHTSTRTSTKTDKNSRAELLSTLNQFNFEDWLARRMELYVIESGECPADLSCAEGAQIPVSLHQWNNLTNTFDLADKVYCSLVQAKESWELPIVLRYGGWGSCPEIAEHAAVLKRWEMLYKARLFGLTMETLDCLVEDGPSESDKALVAARELAAYCPDIVDPVEGLNTFAREITGQSVWSFWWETEADRETGAGKGTDRKSVV